MTDPESAGSGFGRAALGWALLAVLLGYTAFIHYGAGPVKSGFEDEWFSPQAFLLRHELTQEIFESAPQAFALTLVPALMLCCAVFLTLRSGLARAIALTAVAAVVLFVFYGVVAPFPWEFFGWRGSATLLLTAATVGFAGAAPFLAGTWLRQSWPVRVALYLPFVAFIVVFLRNATGTDPSLPFSISPWPAVPVFGLEVGALFVALWLLGTGIGVAAIARGRDREAGARRLIAGGLLLAVAAPVLLLLLGSALGTLPFSADGATLVSVVVLCALTIGVIAITSRRDSSALSARAQRLLVGAALVGVPLVSGQAWAYLDYYVTREVRAREIIDALEAYLERETLYPDTLAELVAAEDLEAIPVPFIGFDFLYDGNFRFQNFGTSFILEFPAPRWVECAYTPPYDEEEGEDDPEEYADGDGLGIADDLDEAWSCPSRPPELW